MISEENDTSLKYPESHFEYFSQSYVKWFKHDSTLKTKWVFWGELWCLIVHILEKNL